MVKYRSRFNNSHYLSRAVARSEIPGGLVVLGGDNVSPLVEIGLADLPNIGGAKAPPAPTLRRPWIVPSYFLEPAKKDQRSHETMQFCVKKKLTVVLKCFCFKLTSSIYKL